MATRNEIVNAGKKHHLVPYLSFKYNESEDKMKSVYWFDNSPYDLEVFLGSDDFKALNMSLENIAKELFSEYNIRYSQENEFFID